MVVTLRFVMVQRLKQRPHTLSIVFKLENERYPLNSLVLFLPRMPRVSNDHEMLVSPISFANERPQLYATPAPFLRADPQGWTVSSFSASMLLFLQLKGSIFHDHMFMFERSAPTPFQEFRRRIRSDSDHDLLCNFKRCSDSRYYSNFLSNERASVFEANFEIFAPGSDRQSLPHTLKSQYRHNLSGTRQ